MGETHVATDVVHLEIFPATNLQFDLEKLNRLLQIPLHQLIENYSTGMKKKLALLAVLKQDKPIYIFDEPFNGLDLESNNVLELILDNLKEKAPIWKKEGEWRGKSATARPHWSRTQRER